jgi:hydrogenase maturation protein HypF
VSGSPAASPEVLRRGIRVRGTVQGVGFRPAVYRLARDLGLQGFVRNDAVGVWIEVEGGADFLARFEERLAGSAPPLARIESAEVVSLPPLGGEGFVIAPSGERREVRAIIPPDAPTCDRCLAELFDPGDRRFRYPFINCTDCGPRYTIVREVPYDRAKTTMAAFALCAQCRAEYEDPASRRFHAEPNACPLCGPRLSRLDAGDGGAGEASDEQRVDARTSSGVEARASSDVALAAAVAALRAGKIVAVKGLGGFHLAADARNEAAVALLRARKQRPRKPFAIMARDLDHAALAVDLSAATRTALLSAARPIVLCTARHPPAVAAPVAPGLAELGVMLPYTPLHHLLLRDGPPFLVMTSGNLAEEPIARANGEARASLGRIADLLLVHDRDIHTRADDSVVRIVCGAAQPVRRSRGLVPEPLALGFDGPPVLAVGAQLKDTVCLTRGPEAFLSPHIGDLDGPKTYAFFLEMIDKLSRLLAVQPALVAHDLHPDYRSTRWALESGLRCEPVQHHHAHIAACLAEHGRQGPVIGVAFDGTGCGPRGELWGGEIFKADLLHFERLEHLRPIALAGGEAAIREPWRLALAALEDAGLPDDRLVRIDSRRRALVRQLIARAPRASGAGRWFDAVAALCGLCDEATYEGQAAIELEAAAAPGDWEPYEFDQLDLRPTVRALASDLDRGVEISEVSARFHATLAFAVLEACRRARARCALDIVALSGGCFQNRLLTERSRSLLEAAGFEVLIHRRVPPNDGGVSLGQAAVASFRALKGVSGCA